MPQTQKKQQFPLILDAWLPPVERRGDHVDKFADENFSFLVANKQNNPYEEVSLEKNEEKNGFCNTVFAVLIQKKALEEEDKEEVRSIDRG
tara:strand:+ start:150 stop:422 length:273 start_codon:yes stop_codon:yes gene_type:complete